MRSVVWLAIAAVGCGRVDFSRVAARDAAPGDGAPADGAAHDASLPGDGPLDDAATARWSLVQVKSARGSASLSINPTGAGHLIVVAAQPSGTMTVTDDGAGDVYTEIPAADATDDDGDASGIWYLASSPAGVTKITTSSAQAFAVWEVAGIRTTNPLDTASAINIGASTTTPVGAKLTTATAGEFVVSVAVVATGVSGTHAGNPFTNDSRANGNGWAHLTSAAAPAGEYQAEWDENPAGIFCASSAAFVVGP